MLKFKATCQDRQAEESADKVLFLWNNRMTRVGFEPAIDTMPLIQSTDFYPLGHAGENSSKTWTSLKSNNVFVFQHFWKYFFNVFSALNYRSNTWRNSHVIIIYAFIDGWEVCSEDSDSDGSWIDVSTDEEVTCMLMS